MDTDNVARFHFFSFSCLTGKTPPLKFPSTPNTVIVKCFSAEIAISVNFFLVL